VLEKWRRRVRAEIDGPIGEAIAYSLSVPGKRFRPALALGVFQALGGEGDATELVCAVEVVHTYSLVHDDLPCMDDDDLRRGMPTTHRKYGAATAMEAGFRMVPLAARILVSGAERLELNRTTTASIAQELFQAAGAGGMIGGQVLDLEAEGRPVTPSELNEIHRRKTGALIAVSAVIGALAARAGSVRVRAVRTYGEELGLAFQIADDILDATRTSEELGKTAGKDARQQKATYPGVVGAEAAMGEARARVRRAIDQLGLGGINSSVLNDLGHFIVNRRF
jgi:geranylgeranyl pyrophosphate synthase